VTTLVVLLMLNTAAWLVAGGRMFAAWLDREDGSGPGG
jgi:hypothetical protein